MTAGRNDCPNPACSRTKLRGMAFCPPCWHSLPDAVQAQVWESFRTRDLLEHVEYLVRLGNHMAARAGDWPEP